MARTLGEAAGHGPVVPRAALLAAAAALSIAVGGSAIGRFVFGAGAPFPETSTLLAARTLRFADRGDGAVVVTDAQTGQSIEILQGENGFVRGTMRALARGRRIDAANLAPGSLNAPFRLQAWADGRLTLDDLADGHRVELSSFGPTNAGEFARMLTAPSVPAAH